MPWFWWCCCFLAPFYLIDALMMLSEEHDRFIYDGTIYSYEKQGLSLYLKVWFGL
jgi:hypothetical protein